MLYLQQEKGNMKKRIIIMFSANKIRFFPEAFYY